MTRARLTNMMNITQNNAMAATKIAAEEKFNSQRTASKMTKAEVSVANTEVDSHYKDTSKVNSLNMYDKQANSSNSALSHTLQQVHESGRTLNNEAIATAAQLLPFLKKGPARNEIQSSALLQFQPSTNSLN